MSIVKIDSKFNLDRGGVDHLFFIQNICVDCGWVGSEHYAYNSSQHSNCKEERERHREICN